MEHGAVFASCVLLMLNQYQGQGKVTECKVNVIAVHAFAAMVKPTLLRI